jgi:hypothetical protein
MPSAFTADIYDGKDVSFRDFALRCTRLMAITIHMRDMDLSHIPSPVIEPDLWYFKAWQEAEAEYAEVKKLTLADAEARSLEEHRKTEQERLRMLETALARHERFSALRAKVWNWAPPTPNHDRFKEAMLEQIDDTCRFSCDAEAIERLRKPTEPTAPDEWLHIIVEMREVAVRNAKQRWEDEQNRAKEKTEWLTALYKSLGG